MTGVVQLVGELLHGGGGGYGAVGSAAAVATMPPSRNISPATMNPAERARRTGLPRPGRCDDLVRPGMVKMLRAFPRELYEPICRMYMRCSRSGLHQYFINLSERSGQAGGNGAS